VIPPGLTPRQVYKAARMLYLLAPPGVGPTRLSYADWERELGKTRKPESNRRLWEATKSTLVAIGAPVRRALERRPDGQRVDLILARGAYEFGVRVLKAVAPLLPPKRPKVPPREECPSRQQKIADRRERTLLLWFMRGYSLRAIAEDTGASVATAWSDLAAVLRGDVPVPAVPWRWASFDGLRCKPDALIDAIAAAQRGLRETRPGDAMHDAHRQLLRHCLAALGRRIRAGEFEGLGAPE
jgi:hypothetical protein